MSEVSKRSIDLDEAWELMKTIRRGLDISDPDSFPVRQEALRAAMVLFNCVSGAEQSPSAERTDIERLSLALTRAMDRGNAYEEALEAIATGKVPPTYGGGAYSHRSLAREVLASVPSLDSEQNTVGGGQVGC